MVEHTIGKMYIVKDFTIYLKLVAKTVCVLADKYPRISYFINNMCQVS